ncbi:IS200/IS605 family transposase [Tolypothrix campylonemoides VB511288]|nr:IS200/IS605 family transposase [Tolypothrix campylonemoides VB511288]KAB8316120.1 IS200/IS605 family transposase [Tolypothrix campylonemoides VB511288]KAB8316896.1 IS200/IS605 family transposase [Tolypothrix campylonemoides VB511288]KAB8316901.1 IS200/IS605 family transposase [Tolypothrix campylonemoides VB511288]KAB8317466.1 IS200/IS605 family transposase [Tolypothrix campylonemoides VB511288]
MLDKYRHKTTSVTLINYHFVWIPKRRKKVLYGLVAKRLEELLYEKTKELDCEILALEIMEDHVHLFLCCPPTLAPDQIMFRLKGYTSRILRQEFPYLLKLPSMWTRSYFCGTAGDASSETIKKYIANQKTR